MIWSEMLIQKPFILLFVFYSTSVVEFRGHPILFSPRQSEQHVDTKCMPEILIFTPSLAAKGSSGRK